MKKKVYEQKINGVVRERMTVNSNGTSGIATIEIFAFDGKLLGREYIVENTKGEMMRFKPKLTPREEMTIRAVERGNDLDY